MKWKAKTIIRFKGEIYLPGAIIEATENEVKRLKALGAVEKVKVAKDEPKKDKKGGGE